MYAFITKNINSNFHIRLLEYPEREQVYLETDKPMKPGKQFSVRLKFEYQLSKSLEGFYLSTYKDQDGKERLVETHNKRTLFLHIFFCI